jgi:hypothetical protein
MKTPQVTRQNRKHVYWQKHIVRWSRSGLSQWKYCQDYSLALSTFSYWKSKLQERDGGRSYFYPVKVAPTSVSSDDEIGPGLRLFVCGNKFKVELEKDFSSACLKKLLSTLEGL